LSINVIDTTHNLIDQVPHSADAAIQSTQRLANQVVEGVSHSLQTAGKQIRNGANHVSDRTATYVRDEPVKSMLIAAATGAALVALASLFTRPRSP
jgi:ElaB/YqjD/DUF883 family membrane-anchored ribosome-binding protein